MALQPIYPVVAQAEANPNPYTHYYNPKLQSDLGRKTPKWDTW